MQLNIEETSPKQKPIPKEMIEMKKMVKNSAKKSKKSSRQTSKEIEISQEKNFKAAESPVRSSKPLLSPKEDKDNSQRESPLKDESSKGHHEMVSLLSNPNMLFNDASSIKCSVDNQNMSNFSIPSITGEPFKATFDCLDGMCYDLISAFVGDKFPSFIFVNRKA